MSDVDTGQVPTENGPEWTETDEAGSSAVTTPEETSDTFPREYVETLRKENADYRTKAKAAEDQVDTLSKRLHSELVTATGRLENPADLPFEADHLDDDEKLTAALDALLADRPYIAKRVVKGDAGQGNRGGGADADVNLLELLRNR